MTTATTTATAAPTSTATTASTAAGDDVERRVRRLSATAARRYLDPDEAVPGHVGDGQLLPTELLSVAGLDLDLTAEQLVALSREEVASLTATGFVFESVLQAGFGLQIAFDLEPTDPRVTFLLHEMGEETRHSRLFVRLLEQLQPKARNPMAGRLPAAVMRRVIRTVIRRPALLYTMVLAGEEIPDLIQKRASEHPDTDPFIRAVNTYHRQEEARHLSFARAVLPEVWAEAGPVDRWLTRHAAPTLIGFMFAMLIHPGVYEAIGLPGWETWRAANQSTPRIALRHEATRPVLQALVNAGAVGRRVPKAWRRLCGV
jgi:P-aminobenzoate N-oxygenase AurF